MATKVAINGFGRIGRLVFRALMETEGEFDVVAVNDLTDVEMLRVLLQYDSVHRRYPAEVKVDGGDLVVGDERFTVLSERDPSKLPWGDLGVEVVLESTGVFRTRDQLQLHLDAGAKRVLLSAPAKDELDATVVMGVNDDALESGHVMVSNASCTTNCLAPMVKVLLEAFGFETGIMTTVHSYTADQRILDMIHPKDPRRARAAAQNIIPTTTGAAKAVGKVIPAVSGKLTGLSLSVPTPDASIVDLTATLGRAVTVETVNDAFKAAAGDGPLSPYLEYSEDPLVSSDIIGNPHSCVFDAGSTYVVGEHFVKVFGWYDNEWGYSMRCVDLLRKMAAL